jgi:hypothetical protein
VLVVRVHDRVVQRDAHVVLLPTSVIPRAEGGVDRRPLVGAGTVLRRPRPARRAGPKVRFYPGIPMCEGIHAIQASAEGSDLRPTQREPTLLLPPYVCGDACARTHPAMRAAQLAGRCGRGCRLDRQPSWRFGCRSLVTPATCRRFSPDHWRRAGQVGNGKQEPVPVHA